MGGEDVTEQEKREKTIGELESCLDDAVAAVVPSDTVQDAIDLLKAQEPVDAVEVVRCRDCKYGLCVKTLTGDCYYECGFQRDECLSDEVYSPDYYCAYGERREES